MVRRIAANPVPLSISPLWSLLRRNYESGDTEAWDNGTIPTYITSNAAVAHRYSRVLLGWIRDLAASGGLDHDEPLQIIELGCGTARFTFHMLLALEDLDTSRTLKSHAWSYLATDVSEKRLRRLEAERPLQRFISRKRLRIALYDAVAGGAILPERHKGPTVVIANYVFDSLPADCFRLQAGRLYETRMDVHEEGAGEGLEGLVWQFSHHPIELPHYGDQAMDGILAAWRARGLSKTILIPTGAVRAIQNVQSFSKGPMLVLAADKVLSAPADTSDTEMPPIELHGASHFSIAVDFELLADLLKAEGWQMLTSDHGKEVIAFAACMRGSDGPEFPETRLAFGDQFGYSSLTAALYIAARLREQAHVLTLHDHLAQLRMAHFDPHQWSSVFPLFIRQITSPPAELRTELTATLDKMAERCYPTRDGGLDMLFLIGCAYLQIGEGRKAREQFAKSIDEFGPRPAVLFQMGRAEFQAGEKAQGASKAREAFTADQELGGFLQRLGVLPGGKVEARQLTERMEWAASLSGLEELPR